MDRKKNDAHALARSHRQCFGHIHSEGRNLECNAFLTVLAIKNSLVGRENRCDHLQAGVSS
ncbi:UNVERIFIED_ORG: hypothetical protein J2Y81_007863 [Paraburkholderia sediminicola]|nr:hypothetical protein [Paraburkholderia sediminicola]